MPRKYSRKTDRGLIADSVMQAGRRDVIAGGSIRSAAKKHGIDRMTLKRFIDKRALHSETRYDNPYNTRQIFSNEQEIMLEQYLTLSCKMNYGLSKISCRRLAYEFGIANNVTLPSSWNDNVCAGADWMDAFLKRHDLGLRIPEGTSLSRGTSFNRKNVDDFFDNLENVLKRKKYGPESIYNVDESGCTTVQKPLKVIAPKSSRQVGKVTSGERGVNVTVCCAVNAMGNSIPPFMIFPRVNFKHHMINGAPPGTEGACHVSGWMTTALFVLWMTHFIKHAHCSMDNPVILILDNHISHISIEALNMAKSNGITMVTFPPHTSHKLQPLDRTVFGPFKRYYNAACDDWMVTHPAQPMTIYNIAEIVGKAFPLSFTPKNIQSGFAVTGIAPYNRMIFGDDEFLPSYVTDRPNPEEPTPGTDEAVDDSPRPGPSMATQSAMNPPPLAIAVGPGDVESAGPTTSTTQSLTPATPNIHCMNPSPSMDKSHTPSVTIRPEDISPFPKAGSRKKPNAAKPMKTRILTDTPVKDQIEKESIERATKRKPVKKSKPQAKRKILPTPPVKPKSIKPTVDESSSDTDCDVTLDDDSGTDESVTDNENTNMENLVVGDFVIVKIAKKDATNYFVAKVTESYDDSDDRYDYEVSYLKRVPSKSGLDKKFIFPDIEDVASVDKHDIVKNLGKPITHGGTMRASKQFSFKSDAVSMYNV